MSIRYNRIASQDRVSRCGSKGSTSAYDPQVGTAATQEANTAQAAQNFDENYYNTTVAPLVAAETKQANTSTDDQNALFNIDLPQAQAQADEYTAQGAPAVKNYYDMVSKYSSDQNEQSQAAAAIGDMRTAEASNAATLQRQQASLGIDPTSGSSQALASDASIQNTAAEAAAATRARYNAQQLGMQLTGDAAGFSNSGISNLTSLGGAASSAASAGTGALATAAAGANAGAGVVNTGFSIANSAYGNNLDAYSKMAAAQIPSQAAGASGLGQAIGALGSLALGAI